MLTFMRKATQGWVARVLLVLLVASFAVWGVSGSIFQGAGNSVIEVGETSVSPVEFRLAYDNRYTALQRQLGSRLTREQAEAFGLTPGVVSQLVSGAVLDEAAREMGLGLSADRLAGIIGEDEAFRDASGRFSRSQLRFALQSIGMSEEQYVETRRAVAIRNQMVGAAADRMTTPDALIDFIAAYNGEQRKFDFITLTADDLSDIPAPDEDVLKAYYDDNLSRYRAPEYRTLDLVKLEAKDIADEGSVTDAEVEAEYQSRLSQFEVAERRTIQQLIFASEEEATAAREKLSSGTSFADLAAELGRSDDAVALGTLAKADIPDPAIAEAAFAAELNTPTEPIDGLFGKVILNVTEISPGTTRPFEEVADELRSALALQKAADDIFDTHDRLEDERAAGEPLAAAAQTIGLTVRTIDAIDRNARDKDGNVISDIPQSREVISEAFETDPGFEINPIAIGTDGFVWIDVKDVEADRQKTFEEVRTEVEADWRAAEIEKALDALAETFTERLSAGEDFNALIAELIGTSEPEAAPQPQQEIAPETTSGATDAGESAEAGSEDPVRADEGNASEAAEATTAVQKPARIAQQTLLVTRDGEAPGLTPQAIAAGFSVPQGMATSVPGANPGERIILQPVQITEETVEVTDRDREALNAALGNDVVDQFIARLAQDRPAQINEAAIRILTTQN